MHHVRIHSPKPAVYLTLHSERNALQEQNVRLARALQEKKEELDTHKAQISAYNVCRYHIWSYVLRLRRERERERERERGRECVCVSNICVIC